MSNSHEFEEKRLRFLAHQLDEHDKNGTTPPAGMEKEFERLSRKVVKLIRERSAAFDDSLVQMGVR